MSPIMSIISHTLTTQFCIPTFSKSAIRIPLISGNFQTLHPVECDIKKWNIQGTQHEIFNTD